MEHPFNTSYQASGLPKSLWAATAEPAPKTTSLSEDKTADIVIIGSGILGLSTALHLAEQGQTNVICLEGSEIGWGASGRNNGQVIPGLKYDPDTVREKLKNSNHSAEALIQCSGDAPALVFSLINKHQIHCEAVNKGWIQPAPSNRAEKEIISRVKQWQALSAPVEMLDKNTLAEKLGTDWYQAAWLDKRGGSVNPLGYTRGLARAVINAGIEIFTKTPVTDYKKIANNQWQINTPNGSVTAKKLIIATNAYIGKLNPQIKTAIVPVRTAQIASEPLDKSIWEKILPHGEAASDASHLLTSFRLTPEKRLVMGGAYATGGNENSAMFNALKQAAKNRFSDFDKINWQYFWSGYLAITPPHLPQIYHVEENCYAPIGCNGRGIAMSTMTGKQLANVVLSEDHKQSSVPVVSPKAHQFHQFRNIGITANVVLSEIKDRLRM